MQVGSFSMLTQQIIVKKLLHPAAIMDKKKKNPATIYTEVVNKIRLLEYFLQEKKNST